MRDSVDPRIFEQFPGFRRAVVVARNINNQGEHPELLALLRGAEEKTRGDEFADYLDHPRLKIWSETFRALNINPKKHLPSVINMIKRVRGGKNLPYVNTLVAIFNYISLDQLISCGGDDLAVVKGDLRLTLAAGDENYTPLGQPGTREHPQPREVIYLDTASREVFCRAWCWKNGDVSKLEPTTTDAAINIDVMQPALTRADMEEAAEKTAALLRRFAGAETAVHFLSPERPEFEF
ncbi:MAG: hypothetical protein LBS31_01775 [Candidatus Adiutrix sp.]|jgi:DNA/RNA-binding domain of Phe-tRNA-synthetase-like protein|nr:hypothetical protein [Candidatus Adiutrix sp.]